MPELPKQYLSIKKRFKKFLRAVDNLGKVSKEAGPLDEKTSHLIQLAAPLPPNLKAHYIHTLYGVH